MAKEALRIRPNLAEHACKSGGFGRFGDKIVGTTLPHLMEHVTIDLLVEWQRDQNRCHGVQNDRLPSPVSGNTKWLDRDRGLMQVSVSATAESSDTVSRAILQAVALVNQLTELPAN